MDLRYFQKTDCDGISRCVDVDAAPIRVVGSESILKALDPKALQQADAVAKHMPGVYDVTLTPDAHPGVGCPIGCVATSQTHVYPGVIGADANCSISLLQIDINADELKPIEVRRRLIEEIEKRVSASYGTNRAPKRRKFGLGDLRYALTCGLNRFTAERFGFDEAYLARFEDSSISYDKAATSTLEKRLKEFEETRLLSYYAEQIGSYGGGNHFGECQRISVVPEKAEIAEEFGLIDGRVGFMSHCGSRGFGEKLALHAQRRLVEKFEKWGIPFPADDPYLVYAPIDSQEAEDIYGDMALARNFALLNHAVINSLVAEAFQEVFPGVESNLIYCVSHNNARYEVVDGRVMLVHRKGATRAYPANHFALRGTTFYETGTPILLPGDPVGGSSVMVAEPGAERSRFSVNHGAGRSVGRKDAKWMYRQEDVNATLSEADVISNQKDYPVDEAPDVYKNFDDVLRSVVDAGLASEVARLKALFVLKGASY